MMENKDDISIDIDKKEKLREIIYRLTKEFRKKYGKILVSISVPKSWQLMLTSDIVYSGRGQETERASQQEKEWRYSLYPIPVVVYGIKVKKHEFDYVYVDFKDGPSYTVNITQRIQI